jgi:hypothetical protein
MKKILLILPALFLLAGCAPRMTDLDCASLVDKGVEKLVVNGELPPTVYNTEVPIGRQNSQCVAFISVPPTVTQNKGSLSMGVLYDASLKKILYYSFTVTGDAETEKTFAKNCSNDPLCLNKDTFIQKVKERIVDVRYKVIAKPLDFN